MNAGGIWGREAIRQRWIDRSELLGSRRKILEYPDRMASILNGSSVNGLSLLTVLDLTEIEERAISLQIVVAHLAVNLRHLKIDFDWTPTELIGVLQKSSKLTCLTLRDVSSWEGDSDRWDIDDEIDYSVFSKIELLELDFVSDVVFPVDFWKHALPLIASSCSNLLGLKLRSSNPLKAMIFPKHICDGSSYRRKSLEIGTLYLKDLSEVNLYLAKNPPCRFAIDHFEGSPSQASDTCLLGVFLALNPNLEAVFFGSGTIPLQHIATGYLDTPNPVCRIHTLNIAEMNSELMDTHKQLMVSFVERIISTGVARDVNLSFELMMAVLEQKPDISWQKLARLALNWRGQARYLLDGEDASYLIDRPRTAIKLLFTAVVNNLINRIVSGEKSPVGTVRINLPAWIFLGNTQRYLTEIYGQVAGLYSAYTVRQQGSSLFLYFDKLIDQAMVSH